MRYIFIVCSLLILVALTACSSTKTYEYNYPINFPVQDFWEAVEDNKALCPVGAAGRNIPWPGKFLGGTRVWTMKAFNNNGNVFCYWYEGEYA